MRITSERVEVTTRLPGVQRLMEIENIIRYTALAVGLKPSARQGEARLRGL